MVYLPGRKPGWDPKIPLRASRVELLVSTILGSWGRGILGEKVPSRQSRLTDLSERFGLLCTLELD